jgi:hypothetical protein
MDTAAVPAPVLTLMDRCEPCSAGNTSRIAIAKADPVVIGGNCIDPGDSGKDGEVDELSKLHSICHNHALVTGLSTRKLPTNKKFVVQGTQNYYGRY